MQHIRRGGNCCTSRLVQPPRHVAATPKGSFVTVICAWTVISNVADRLGGDALKCCDSNSTEFLLNLETVDYS